jgi:hypothetical protein
MQIFLSYAHEDARRLEDFRLHLQPIGRLLRARFWHDRNINAGQVWGAEIEQAIATSDAFLLFATNAFLSSDYIMNTELPKIR